MAHLRGFIQIIVDGIRLITAVFFSVKFCLLLKACCLATKQNTNFHHFQFLPGGKSYYNWRVNSSCYLYDLLQALVQVCYLNSFIPMQILFPMFQSKISGRCRHFNNMVQPTKINSYSILQQL